MVFVKVMDMAIGKTYLVNEVPKKLKGKDLTGNGGNQGMDPDYKLVFEDDSTIVKTWDDKYEEVVVPVGGKRKSRLNRKTRRKSRKNRRKSNNRRRH